MASLFQVENLFWIGLAAAAAALVFAGVKVYRLLKLPQGDQAGGFAPAIREGAALFLRRQAAVGAPLFLLALLLLFVLERLGALSDPNLPLSFLTGGLCAAGAGLAALLLCLLSVSRVSAAVEGGVHNSFNAAFSAGSAAAFAGVGLALLESFLWFHILRYGLGYDPARLAGTMALFGAGAACAAFLLRLESGVFAKAAGLGAGNLAETVGEAPEPSRGPAPVADWVGNAAVNAAGAAADLYAAFSLSILLGLSAAELAYSGDVLLWNAMLYPAAVAAVGVFCSLLSCLLVRAGENSDESSLLALLRKGRLTAAALTALLAAPLSYLLTGSWRPLLAVAAGLIAAQAAVYLSCRISSNLYSDIRRLSSSAENGLIAELTSGGGMGLRSSAALLGVLVLAVLFSFLVSGGELNAAYETLYRNALPRGLYGVALAGVGFFSTSGFSLSAALLSPILDGAGKCARASELDKSLLGRAAVLEALGAGLSGLGRALPAGGTLLAAPVLLWLYTLLAQSLFGAIGFSAASPMLLAGVFAGAVFAAVFLSRLLSEVYNCVQPMAAELRRQSREASRTGRWPEGGAGACIDLCARNAAIRSLVPGLLAMAAPLASAALLGIEGTAGFLTAAALLGLSGALFLSAAGSALDCVRRRVDTERRGSAGARRCAVTAGLLGDLLRDCVGPSMAALVRLCLTAAPLLTLLAARYSLLSLPV